MLKLSEFDERILDFFSWDTKAPQLFLVLAFMMQRNMAGGLTTYDLMAIKNVKESLKKLLDQVGDKHIVNALIEILSTAEHKDLARVIDSNSARYIQKQDYRELCKILATYLPNDIGMMIKIPIDDDLDLDLLISQAKKEHPRTALGIDVSLVNPWQVIFSPPSIEDVSDCIIISCPSNTSEERSLYYLKGLCMAKSLLAEDEEEEVVEQEVEKESVSIRPMNIYKGILAISSRISGAIKKKPNSKPFIARSVEDSVEQVEVEDVVDTEELSPYEVGELIVEEGRGEIVQKDDNNLSAGFFDVNHGYYFSIRRRLSTD